MESVKENRDSNIELLRIIAMLAVISLHYNNVKMGGGYLYVTWGSFNHLVLQVFEAAGVCAVNVFVIISGYFLFDKDRRYLGKALSLIFQLIVFNIFNYLFKTLMGIQAFNIKDLLKASLPVNWFIILYCALYLISPLINKALRAIKKENLKSVILTLIILFSVWNTFADLIGKITGEEILGMNTISYLTSGNGYTIVQFILCYIIGASIKILDIPGKVNRIQLAGAFIICIVLITLWERVDPITSRQYSNILIIVEAVSLFLLFLKTKIPYNKLINLISGASFTVYLVHTSFLPFIFVEDMVNTWMQIPHILISCLAIYSLCFLIDRLYKLATGFFTKKLVKFGSYYWADQQLGCESEDDTLTEGKTENEYVSI